MKKLFFSCALFVLFAFFPTHTDYSEPRMLLEELESFKLNLELRLLNQNYNKELLNKISESAQKKFESLQKNPKVKKEDTKRAKELVEAILSLKKTALKTISTDFQENESCQEFDPILSMVNLARALEDLKKRSKNPEMHISGYYLERALKKSKEVAELLKIPEAKKLSADIENIGNIIANKWFSKMKKLENDLANYDMPESRMIYIAINDRDEFEALKEKVKRDKKKFQNILRNFLGGPKDKDHAVKLFAQLDKSITKGEVETTRDLFNYNASVLIEMIQKAEKTAQELEDLIMFAPVLLRLDEVEAFDQLKNNYQETIEFLSENKREIDEKLLRTYVYLPLRKNLKKAAKTLFVLHRKPLEKNKKNIEGSLKNINKLNISELEKLNLELEKFSNLISRSLMDENYIFFLEKLFDKDEKAKEYKKFADYVDFADDSKQIIDLVKKATK